MVQKINPLSLIILILGLFYMHSLNAMQAIISLQETQQRPSRSSKTSNCLSIRGDVKTNAGPIRIRNVEASDITNTDEPPGALSIARTSQDDTKGSSAIMIHCETKLLYDFGWKKQLEEGPHYDPTLLYVLEDMSMPLTPTFVGYVILSEEKKTQLGFTAHIVPSYQGKKIMTQIGECLLKDFIPTLQSHALTSEKTKLYQTLVFKVSPENPNAERLAHAIERFSASTRIQIVKCPTKYEWTIRLTPLAAPTKNPASSLKNLRLETVEEDDEDSTPKRPSATYTPNIPRNVSFA
ncbi:MAG TPA: hypothetical protein PLY23_08760 [Alphaproteobacteria bacterium]|nr:hypothetical protein [Alphaproteobacteria bacterium]HQS94723.1 hypothetical protein [Alphaproteobacteria bacterium]